MGLKEISPKMCGLRKRLTFLFLFLHRHTEMTTYSAFKDETLTIL